MTSNGANPHHSKVRLAILGGPDFCRRVTSLTANRIVTYSGHLAEAWSLILTHRPNALLLEIGVQYNDRSHAIVRKLLAQVRERLGNEVYVMVMLANAEKFAFGGDLLFGGENDLSPSGFVDTFLALPPGATASVPGLLDQLDNALTLYAHELDRRTEGRVPLPALGQQGWVQSLADPQSRELWMRWLPRYASYTNENPIIIGETGTGKTNLAYSLHLLSGRKGKFIGITPRDFSSSELVQAELFGAVAGAYTGAVDKWGLVKSAEGGTLFIDELQSIDKDLQGKLITFIENKTYRRVGSAESVEADVRFVFASNKTLYEMMESDILRHDFAYRLERMQLELQSLHLRPLDVSAALAYALAKIYRQRPYATRIMGFSTNAYRLLFCHEWPGNLRQLENCVAQLCELTDIRQASLIDESAIAALFTSRLSGPATESHEVIARAAQKLSQLSLSGSISSIEQGHEKLTELVRAAALDAAGGDTTAAAKLINDNPDAVHLFAQALVARREVTTRNL